MNRRFASALVVAALATMFGTGLVAARSGTLSAELLAVRAAVARYHDYTQAVRDGYSLAGEPCVSSPSGTMGYHAINLAIAISGLNDPQRPPILLYAPKDDGLQLVAVEYFQVAIANTDSGPALWWAPTPPPLGFLGSAPSMFGQTFNGPMAGHNPEMPWHYDLHAWVVEANPAGVFAQFNPAVSCGS